MVQLTQPKGQVSKETNKDSIARKFGCKKSEVTYDVAGSPLAGYKVIYEQFTQRSYSLPVNISGTITSLTNGILIYSSGTVDLGSLAVNRNEYVTLAGDFISGATLQVKNETLTSNGIQYHWDNTLPKTVPPSSTPENTGGIGAGKWLPVIDSTLRAELAGQDGFKLIGTIPDVATLRTVPGVAGSKALLLKYNSSDKNGVSVVYWDSASTVADNGGTVFAVTGVTTGRWVRKYQILSSAMWGLPKSGDCYAELVQIEALMFADKVSCDFYEGTYAITGSLNMPWRNTGVSSFKSYGGAKIICHGNVVFSTASPDGADVFQLNCVSDFSIIGFPVLKATISSTTGAGSNGVSVTNGGKNLYIEVEADSLPGTIKPDYIDGGKAISIQNGSLSTLRYENVKLRCRRAFNCPYGFEMSVVTDKLINNPNSGIDVEIYVDGAYRGVSISGGDPTLTIPSNGLDYGLSLKAVLKDCQQDFVSARDWRIYADVSVIQTRTPDAWTPNDTAKKCFLSQGSKFSRFRVHGLKLNVDTMFSIGGITYGSTGTVGNCQGSYYDLTVSAQTVTTKLSVINIGGNTAVNCNLISNSLSSADVLPLIGAGNTVQVGAAISAEDLSAYNSFNFYNNAGIKKFGVDANGALSMIRTTSAPIGTTAAGKIAITDLASGLTFWIPLFTS